MLDSAPNLPARISTPWPKVVAGSLVVLSIVGGAFGLREGGDPEWIPLFVSAVGILAAVGQAVTQREHSREMAHAQEGLKRATALLERRVEATTNVTRAMREIIECAASPVRAADAVCLPPANMLSASFHEGAHADILAFRTNAEVLRLLADVPTMSLIDEFADALRRIDTVSTKNQVAGDAETLHNDIEDLRAAHDEFKSIYDRLVAHLRTEFRP